MTSPRPFKANGNIARIFSKDNRELPKVIQISTSIPAPARSGSGSSDYKIEHGRNTQTNQAPTASRGSPTTKATSELHATKKGPIYSRWESDEPASMLDSDQGPHIPRSKRLTPRADAPTCTNVRPTDSDSVWLHERVETGDSVTAFGAGTATSSAAGYYRQDSYAQYQGRGRTPDSRTSTLRVPGAPPARSSSAEPTPRSTLVPPPMMTLSTSAPQGYGIFSPPDLGRSDMPVGPPFLPASPALVGQPIPHITIEQVVHAKNSSKKMKQNKKKEKEKEQLEAAHGSTQALFAAAPPKTHQDKWESQSDSGSSESGLSSFLGIFNA